VTNPRSKPKPTKYSSGGQSSTKTIVRPLPTKKNNGGMPVTAGVQNNLF